MIGMVWFREDLRIVDHKALHFAAKQCGSGIVGIYIIDRMFLEKHDVAACRIDFTLRGLEVLSKELAGLNIPLLIMEIDNTHLTVPTLAKAIQQCGAQSLFFNKQYEIDESRRDLEVKKYLEAQKISCHSYDDQVILAPGSIRTQQGSYFKVFTPYKRAWYQKFSIEITPRLLAAPKPQSILPIKPTPVPQNISGYHSLIDPGLWPVGEKFARQRLKDFIKNHLFDYDRQRDFPALSGTSQLSPYLASGMISIRECFFAAFKANHQQLTTGDQGAVVWMSELIWREFYKHILVAVPRVSKNKAYQLKTEKLPWSYDQSLFDAWAQGNTGIPIIDAAMRQLNSMGWMHNRLRMIAASFLAKNLRIDWRWGEKYFMQHLIDGDLAANNGGWQWCASTGVDAVPYFRVFNPLRQGVRFDPDAVFIRQFCPELKHLTAKQIHDLEKLSLLNLDYPSPIVDIDKTRRRFIADYKKLFKA